MDRRMQFVPTSEQAEAIKAEAAATGRSVASVLREAVEQWRLARNTAPQIERTLSASRDDHAARLPLFSSGLTNLASTVDEELDGFGER